MALSDLAVFSEYTYSAFSEVLAQQVDLFNEASMGTILLRSAAHQGDFSDTAFWAKIQGLVRRRNPYGSGAVAGKVLSQLVDTMVKIAAGTPPVSIDPSMFKWIQANEEEGGAVFGQQLAKDTLADILNTSLMGYVAALAGQPTANYDDSASAGTSMSSFLPAAAKFGDAANSIAAWVMHSTPAFAVFGSNLDNTNRIFSFGTVNVRQDGFGRPFVISDSPSLVIPAGADPVANPAKYLVPGLVPGAIVCEMNDDFVQNIQTVNGGENIARTIQAEWSWELGYKGYSWSKALGGKAPNDAALATAANWVREATDIKNTAGVLLKVSGKAVPPRP
jgi:hypothetical protein